ncbi:MAG: regulatory protein TetR [Panacagrimonas sp.]|jgi:AcrR family transcriptional regulator|nr:TetR/AcrR family transcriptional regulator [Panacagrimonas sp.]MCC2658757.1 regulatory protein TetR [Panacagrimonas sp.]
MPSAGPRPARSSRVRDSTGRGQGRKTPVTRESILSATARIYVTEGYAGTTIRDIAAAQGLLPGSIYHHFSSKEKLIIELYERGIDYITQAVCDAIDGVEDPWKRLEIACAVHIDALVNGKPHAGILPMDIPSEPRKLVQTLVKARQRYETIFRDLVAALELGSAKRSRMFRLQLLGSLNWSTRWYDAGGPLGPSDIAREFVANLRR